MLPMLCGIAMNEPGWAVGEVGLRTAFRSRNRFLANTSFWSSYHTVLMVRNPWTRFSSHVDFLHGLSNVAKRPLWSERTRAQLRNLDKHNVEHLLNCSAPEVVIARSNFLTQHLVVDFLPSSNCTQEFLARGLAAVDAFDLVLNIADWPGESIELAAACLGVRAASATGTNLTHRHRSNADARLDIGGPGPAQFQLANECDMALTSRANQRLRELAALVRERGGVCPLAVEGMKERAT